MPAAMMPSKMGRGMATDPPIQCLQATRAWGEPGRRVGMAPACQATERASSRVVRAVERLGL